MKLAGRMDFPHGAPPSSWHDGRGGFLLGECLIYISVWSVLLGFSFAAFYRAWDNAARLRRNAADIARVVQVGERWREDIRRATGPVKLVTGEGSSDYAFHVPQAAAEVVYFYTGTNVLRRAADDRPWTEVLAGVKASRLNQDIRGPLVAWRWEVELNAGKRRPLVRPLFTFQAVAATKVAP